MVNMYSITDWQIKKLREAAYRMDDTKLIKTCDDALLENEGALEKCVNLIAIAEEFNRVIKES